mmetsp:Transcript_12933/g.33901  ORF Transcript_12933/g.33901 Transcript_12933/m.33901 type:complete len:476 (-) Transcript_12933:1171-2598(-)
MRDRQDRQPAKLGAKQRLHRVVRLAVEVGRRLVEHEDRPRPRVEQRAREAEQLPFAGRQVGAALVDGHVHHLGRQPRAREGLAHGGRAFGAERVEVVPDGARVQHGLLRDDVEHAAAGGEAERAQLSAVDEDGAGLGLEDSEEGEDDRRLARARAPHDRRLAPRRDRRAHAVDGEGQPAAVAHAKRAELDRAARRPFGGRRVGRQAARRLGGHVEILEDPLERGERDAHVDVEGGGDAEQIGHDEGVRERERRELRRQRLVVDRDDEVEGGDEADGGHQLRRHLQAPHREHAEVVRQVRRHRQPARLLGRDECLRAHRTEHRRAVPRLRCVREQVRLLHVRQALDFARRALGHHHDATVEHCGDRPQHGEHGPRDDGDERESCKRHAVHRDQVVRLHRQLQVDGRQVGGEAAHDAPARRLVEPSHRGRDDPRGRVVVERVRCPDGADDEDRRRDHHQHRLQQRCADVHEQQRVLR